MKSIIFYIFIALFILFPGVVFSQPEKNLKYPSGYLPALDYDKIRHLKKMMNKDNPDWVKIKHDYFEDIYDPELPDLFCYITKNNAKISLVKNNKKNITELFGERYIWLIILSDYDLNRNGTHKDSLYVFDLEVLAYEIEPSANTIRGILNAISQSILNKEIDTRIKTHGLEDSTYKIKFTPNIAVSECNTKDTLYTYMEQIHIGLNTKNRIVIRPSDNLKKRDFLFINYNFGNYEDSRLNASLGFGPSIGVTKKTCEKIEDDERVNLYVFAHLAILKPKLPVDKKSYSIIMGTNFISGKTLNHLVLGGRCGYFNPIGIILGMDWALLPKESSRDIYLFCGLDYCL